MNAVALTYLALLGLSLAGLAVLDWHRRLALFADARRTLVALGAAVGFFLGWDTLGIAFGVFSRGDVPYMTGVELWPEMPLEEPVFLILLCYVTLLVWRLLVTRGGDPRALPVRERTRREVAR